VTFLTQFAAAFLTLHVPLGPDAKLHVSYGYCDPGMNGPKGWARSYLDTEWQAYVRDIQTSNCTLIARQVRANLNF